MTSAIRGNPFKEYYSSFLERHRDKYHFAGHSHHFWPDASEEGQRRAWQVARDYSDNKWNLVFSELIPSCQEIAAGMIGHNSPENLVFAPNTHEFVLRLFSCLPVGKKWRVLTSDQEFYSFSEQLDLLENAGLASAVRLEAANLHEDQETFFARLEESLSSCQFDLVFFSHCFFSNAQVLNLEKFAKLVEKIPPKTLICLDGYHSFAAFPFELGELQKRVFFMGGGYKYAQAGEGMCFLALPDDLHHQPWNRGWYSNFVENKHAAPFWGATFDPSGLFRFASVWNSWKSANLGLELQHRYVQQLQQYFLKRYEDSPPKELSQSRLLSRGLGSQGHFFSFLFEGEAESQKALDRLRSRGVLCDVRKSVLRLGFAPYLDYSDIDVLFGGEREV